MPGQLYVPRTALQDLASCLGGKRFYYGKSFGETRGGVRLDVNPIYRKANKKVDFRINVKFEDTSKTDSDGMIAQNDIAIAIKHYQRDDELKATRLSKVRGNAWFRNMPNFTYSMYLTSILDEQFVAAQIPNILSALRESRPDYTWPDQPQISIGPKKGSTVPGQGTTLRSNQVHVTSDTRKNWITAIVGYYVIQDEWTFVKETGGGIKADRGHWRSGRRMR